MASGVLKQKHHVKKMRCRPWAPVITAIEMVEFEPPNFSQDSREAPYAIAKNRTRRLKPAGKLSAELQSFLVVRRVDFKSRAATKEVNSERFLQGGCDSTRLKDC